MPEGAMLSVVIPAYNEAGVILDVLGETRRALAELSRPSEVIVVDDASTDTTASLVEQQDGVRLVRNPVNLGYGHSLMRGMATANGELILICDADGSYDLTVLPALVALIDRGVDHAIAQRTGPLSKRPWFRRHAYRWLCQYVAGQRVPDANSGLRIFRRDLYEDVLADLCLGFSFTTSLTLASLLSGHVVAFVPMPYRARVGRSHVRFRDMLRTAQYLFQLVAAYNPIKLFLPLVAATALLSAAACGLAVVVGGIWAPVGAVLIAASATLVGLAAHAYTVSRAAAGPIRPTRGPRRPQGA